MLMTRKLLLIMRELLIPALGAGQLELQCQQLKRGRVLKGALHSSLRLRFCRDLLRFLAVVTARMLP